MEILKAKMSDINGIMDLHNRYHINSINPDDKPYGFVTTNFTPQQIQTLIEEENGITIAKDGNRIIAYAMAASWKFWSEWPLFAYMIDKLPENSFNGLTLNIDNSYQYGPICIDKLYRGSGIFEKVFYTSLESMMSRYLIMITFINQINHKSYASHTKKVGMKTIGAFQFNNNDYYMLASPTKYKQ